MVGWIILAVICLILAIVLFTPAGGRVTYDQGSVVVNVRFGPILIPVYPREKGKKEASPRKEEKEQPPEGQEEQTKAKKKLRVNQAQILYTLEKLPPVLGKALKRVGKSLRFSPLKLHLLVAGSDPAQTAILFGKLEAALNAGLPVLHRITRIRDQDIRLFLDFQEERMDCIADVGVSTRLWDLLVMALFAGAGVFKWFLGFRRLADKPAPADQSTEDRQQTEPADPAGAAATAGTGKE